MIRIEYLDLRQNKDHITIQVPFMSGRIDCQPDPAKKWTPFDFEATEVERQSNPRGTGNQVEHLRI